MPPKHSRVSQDWDTSCAVQLDWIWLTNRRVKTVTTYSSLAHTQVMTSGFRFRFKVVDIMGITLGASAESLFDRHLPAVRASCTRYPLPKWSSKSSHR